MIALGEWTVGAAGLLYGPLREFARFQKSLGTAADQEVDGPGGILGLGGGEGTLESVDLGIGLGGRAERGGEFGKGLHSDFAPGWWAEETCGSEGNSS